MEAACSCETLVFTQNTSTPWSEHTPLGKLECLWTQVLDHYDSMLYLVTKYWLYCIPWLMWVWLIKQWSVATSDSDLDLLFVGKHSSLYCLLIAMGIWKFDMVRWGLNLKMKFPFFVLGCSFFFFRQVKFLSQSGTGRGTKLCSRFWAQVVEQNCTRFWAWFWIPLVKIIIIIIIIKRSNSIMTTGLKIGVEQTYKMSCILKIPKSMGTVQCNCSVMYHFQKH